LILGKISKFDAIGQILRLKCTKFDFRWDSALDTAERAYRAPPDPIAVFKGPTSKGRQEAEGGQEKGRGREREGEGKGKTGKGRGGERKGERGEGRRGEGTCRTNVKLLPTRLPKIDTGIKLPSLL